MRRFITTTQSPEAEFGFARAVIQDPFVFLSCVYGYDPESMTMPEDVTQQTCNCWDSIAATLQSAESALEEIVKARIYVTDPAYGEPVLDACARRMADILPASTLMVVSGLMRPEMKVGIEVTAMWSLAREW
ncbi:Rid family hydrolase [Saliniramus sp.]|uniref:Rid family hydrolase n=1 Tax=Saliniramus sp. TaxID=2986772 RepID=UPI002C2A31A1|nr:Rid family hydrolase [Saliniramus sp.]HMB10783.1 Rid family hydrolase [Saliniramus sp.]